MKSFKERFSENHFKSKSPDYKYIHPNWWNDYDIYHDKYYYTFLYYDKYKNTFIGDSAYPIMFVPKSQNYTVNISISNMKLLRNELNNRLTLLSDNGIKAEGSPSLLVLLNGVKTVGSTIRFNNKDDYDLAKLILF